MKVLLLRSDSIRHRYLSSFLTSEGFEIIEVIEACGTSNKIYPPSVSKHFEARDQIEHDFFSDLVNSDKAKNKNLQITSVNHSEALLFAKMHKPDLVLTFGCGILGAEWLSNFPNQIIGIHLGLSPYYRGAGTNFFPFVNNELGAVGYTLMNLDKGVDTGPIIHQAYGKFIQGDGIHTVGTRLMRSMFNDIVKILRSKTLITDSIKQPLTKNQKIYKKSDFTAEILEKALLNIRLGMIDNYIGNIQIERDRFPLVRKLLI